MCDKLTLIVPGSYDVGKLLQMLQAEKCLALISGQHAKTEYDKKIEHGRAKLLNIIQNIISEHLTPLHENGLIIHADPGIVRVTDKPDKLVTQMYYRMDNVFHDEVDPYYVEPKPKKVHIIKNAPASCGIGGKVEIECARRDHEESKKELLDKLDDRIKEQREMISTLLNLIKMQKQ